MRTHRRSDAVSNANTILDAATQVLARDPAAGMAEIARAAGLSRRTVYGHFSNREDLVHAIASRLGERLESRLAAVGDRDPVEALGRICSIMAAEIVGYHRIGALALRSGAREAVAERLTSSRQRLQDLVAQAQDSGRATNDLSAATALSVIIGVQQGVFEAVVAGHLDATEAAATASRTCLLALGIAPTDQEGATSDE